MCVTTPVPVGEGVLCPAVSLALDDEDACGDHAPGTICARQCYSFGYRRPIFARMASIVRMTVTDSSGVIRGLP